MRIFSKADSEDRIPARNIEKTPADVFFRTGTVSHREPPLILVVDDEEVSRQLMCDALEMAGFSVEQAEDGVQALAAFERLRPDLILMDVVMPRMDGITACSWLRQMPGGESTPVLMVTGLNDLESIHRSYEAGATDFLIKPFKWMILEQRIRYTLRASRTVTELRQSEAQLITAQRIARLGNWEWDIDRDLFICSEEICRIFCLQQQEVCLAYDGFLSLVHPEDRGLLKRSLEKSIKKKEPFRLDYRIVAKDGSGRFVHHQAEAVFDKNGGIIRMVGTIQDVTERKTAEEKILFLAYHDTLTNLPNRHFLKEYLKQSLAYAERHGRMVALLFLDLDCFKQINDTLGHDSGDLLLQKVADRLLQCVRRGDSIARPKSEESNHTVIRLGGDEFTILLTDINSAQDASIVAQRILSELAQSFTLGTREVFIGASIGITVYPPDGRDAETLLKNADMAMYHAKEQGKNNYQYYTESMNAVAIERLDLQNSLRRALDREEFHLFYQPQVDITTGRITSVEALIRWLHPERGMLLPSEFIPHAEESGLIIPITNWVLRTACIQGKLWQSAGLGPIRINVNLSSRQFRGKEFTGNVARVLEETGLDPSILGLELTENVFLNDSEETIVTLKEWKRIGIHLSLDDFGTGYSSLSYLQHFPLDFLKIDQSFIRNVTTDSSNAAITKAIIAMAHALSLKVIAEGVETEEQLMFLKDQRCDKIQGHLYSPALSAEALTALILKEKTED